MTNITNRVTSWLVCSLLASTLVACQHYSASTEQPASNNQQSQLSHMNSQLKQRWRVMKFMNYSTDTLHNAYLDLTALPRANAYAGCNQIMFDVRTTDQQFIVGDIISTYMACMDNTLESELISALKQATTYQLDGNLLKIQTHHNQTILLTY